VTAGLTLVALAALPSSLSAQQQNSAADAHDDEARGLFLAGRAAYEDARYQDAFDYFRRSYELSKRPELLYNIGQAAAMSGRDREALDAFEAYIREVPDAENRREVEEQIDGLRARLSGRPLEEDEPDRMTDGEEPETEVDEFRFQLGAHLLVPYFATDSPELDIGFGARGWVGLLTPWGISGNVSAGAVTASKSLEDSEVTDVFFRAGIRYPFSGLEPIIPFIGGGLAANIWSTERTYASGEITDVSETSVSIDFIGGAIYHVTDGLGVEAGAHLWYDFGNEVFNNESVTWISFVAGVAYTF
jgi:tetratricopeptide (TPR) repeat protein